MSSLSRWLLRISKRFQAPARRPQHAAWTNQRHYLLRVFEMADLQNIYNGTVNYGPFDAFYYNRQYADTQADAACVSLMNKGKKGFFYYSTMDFPPDALDTEWANWYRSNVQFGSPQARIFRTRSGNTVVGCFSYYCNQTTGLYRELVDWTKITDAKQNTILAQMLANSITLHPAACVFLDQAWLDIPYYMIADVSTGHASCGPVESEHGATRASIPHYLGATVAEIGTDWLSRVQAVSAFYGKAEAACNARQGWALKNGEWTTVNGYQVQRPIFIENAGNIPPGEPPGTLRQLAVQTWLDNPRNVMEVKILPHPNPLNPSFYAMREIWRQTGGWVCVNGIDGEDPDHPGVILPAEGASGVKMQEAYASLSEIRGTA